MFGHGLVRIPRLGAFHAQLAGEFKTSILPAALVFLILLLNDAERMGSLKNTRAQNIISVTVVGIIVVLSTLYGVSALFPNLLR